MAREIIFAAEDNPSNLSLYYVAYGVDDGKYLKGSAVETYNASHWADYAVSLTLSGSNYYGDFAAPYGNYIVNIYGQAGSQPATTDSLLADGSLTAGPYATPDASTGFAGQLVADASIFINGDEFAEQVTYKPFDNANTAGTPKTILAVVDRHLPEVITDEGKVIADYIELSFKNDATEGVTQINRQRDKINVSGRYGGAPKDHLIFAVLQSDQGIWHVRAR